MHTIIKTSIHTKFSQKHKQRCSTYHKIITISETSSSVPHSFNNLPSSHTWINIKVRREFYQTSIHKSLDNSRRNYWIISKSQTSKSYFFFSRLNVTRLLQELSYLSLVNGFLGTVSIRGHMERLNMNDNW